MWSPRGLMVVGHDRLQNVVACETTHLTVFAVLETTLKCSNLGVLSQHTLEQLGSTDWHRRPGAILILAGLVTGALVLIFAARYDLRNRRNLLWDDCILLTRNAAFNQEKHERESWGICVKRMCQAIHGRKLGRWIIGKLTRFAAASDTWVNADDIHLFIFAFQADSEDILAVAHSDIKPATGRRSANGKQFVSTVVSQGRALQVQVTQRAEHFILEESFWGRVWKLLKVVHPCIECLHVSVITPTLSRAACHVASVFGVFFTNALFFGNFVGDTCAVGGVWDTLHRQIWIGVSSYMLSGLPILLISFLQLRDFIYREDWDAQTRRNKVLTWVAFDVLLALSAGTFVLLSCFYAICFIASTNEVIELKWLFSTATSLICKFVFLPLLQAMAYASTVSIILFTYRGDRIHDVVQHSILCVGGKTLDAADKVTTAQLEGALNIQRRMRGVLARRHVDRLRRAQAAPRALQADTAVLARFGPTMAADTAVELGLDDDDGSFTPREDAGLRSRRKYSPDDCGGLEERVGPSMAADTIVELSWDDDDGLYFPRQDAGTLRSSADAAAHRHG